MTSRQIPLSRRAVLGGGIASLVGGSNAPRAQNLVDAPAFQSINITARPIPHFARGDVGRRRFGSLEFRHGLVLTSADPAFGGWSGLVVEPDGRRMLAVSDEGTWLAAQITYAKGLPIKLAEAKIGPIRAVGGRVLGRKRDLDAEALALVDGNLTQGTALIGFERNHRIGRFPIVDGAVRPPTSYLKSPPEARRMRSNKGFEAITVLRGGPFAGGIVAFSERYPDNPALHTGWLWVNGEPKSLAYADVGQFEVTDAVSLADGTLLVLERQFRWTEGVRMRIRRFSAKEVRPGAVMESETLIEADMSHEIDNMEAMGVHRTADGETVLTLMSDDNFNSFLQRTILLQFTLLDDGRAARRAP